MTTPHDELPDPVQRMRTLHDQALSFYKAGQYEEALASFDEALPLFRNHGLPADLAMCLMNRATCLQDLGRREEALAAYDEALPLYRQHRLPADLANCLMNRAACLDDLGRREDALAAYDEALPLFRNHGLPVDLAGCLMNRAICLRALGQREDALAAYDEALPLFRNHGLPADLAMCLMNRAICLRDLGRHEEALAACDEAFTTEDRASTMLQVPIHRVLARELTADRYRFATRLALQQDQPDRAWTYVQRGKGRTLTDLLAARVDLTALDRQELLLTQQHQAGFLTDEAFTAAMRHIGDQRKAQPEPRGSYRQIPKRSNL